MKILQSTIERLLYGLLLLVFIAYVVMTIVMVDITKQLNSGVKDIENKQNCIAAFFLQSNRTNITLANLSSCNDVTKNVRK